MKIIKINTDHYIIVDDSEIKEGGYVFLSDEIYYVTELNEDFIILDNQTMNSHIGVECERYKLINKITHSTQPLNTKFNDWFDAQIITLSEVKELIGEVDVEKKAKNHLDEHHNNEDIAHPELYDEYNSFLKGYNQALEDNKDKKYTEEDLRKAISETRRGMLFLDKYVNEFIQSLQPKTEWEVEFDENGKLKLV